MKTAALLLATLALSCGGSGDDHPAADAAGSDAPALADAPPGTPDAMSGTPDAMSGTPDAPPGTPDASSGRPDGAPGVADASPADASTTDAGRGCGGVGDSCTSTCPSPLMCYSGGAGGVCAPDRATCGGFAGTPCMDPSAPLCLYLAGSELGICVNDFEKSCICAISPTAVTGC